MRGWAVESAPAAARPQAAAIRARVRARAATRRRVTRAARCRSSGGCPSADFAACRRPRIGGKEFVVVNLKRLAALGVETVDPALMVERGIIRAADKVKVLGDGTLAGRITIRAHAFSSSAKEKIAAAGGMAELIEDNPKLNA